MTSRSVWPIIPALFSVLLAPYYSQNYAGILASPLMLLWEMEKSCTWLSHLSVCMGNGMGKYLNLCKSSYHLIGSIYVPITVKENGITIAIWQSIASPDSETLTVHWSKYHLLISQQRSLFFHLGVPIQFSNVSTLLHAKKFHTLTKSINKNFNWNIFIHYTVQQNILSVELFSNYSMYVCMHVCSVCIYAVYTQYVLSIIYMFCCCHDSWRHCRYRGVWRICCLLSSNWLFPPEIVELIHN